MEFSVEESVAKLGVSLKTRVSWNFVTCHRYCHGKNPRVVFHFMKPKRDNLTFKNYLSIIRPGHIIDNCFEVTLVRYTHKETIGKW